MDLFQYHATIANFESLKYVHELEAEIRKLNTTLNANYYYNLSSSILKDYTSYKLKYKAYTKALNLFETKSKKQLPEFIYRHKTNVHNALMDQISSEADNRIIYTYDELIDLLEFDDEMILSHTSFEVIPVLHSIIQDKPIHFRIRFKNFNLNKFSSNSLDNCQSGVKQLIRMTRHKQVLSPNKPSTVIDAAIDYWRTKVTTTPESLDLLTNAITQIDQQSQAAKTVAEYLKEHK